MNAGIFLLGLAYVLSQFFRAFLAVLAPVLSRDLGVTPDDLAFASGMWFLAFAAMQIPVGRVRKLAMGPEYVGVFTVGDQLLWGAAEPLRRMLRILLDA